MTLLIQVDEVIKVDIVEGHQIK